MRIFAAGIATETNTFSPLITGYEDFLVQRGADVLLGRVDHPSLDLSVVWGAQAKVRGDIFLFSLNAWAQPGGITIKSAYERLRNEMLDDLIAAMPVDVVLLCLHGAMVAEGYDHCEEDILRHVREIVGHEAAIGVEFDLHCHLTPSLVATADIIVTYKEYPHDDINERAREVFDLTIAASLGRIQPTMALFDCRMLGMYPTTRQPLRGFVDAIQVAERQDGVLSISFAHGFQFADVPHVGAKILVVTDNDPCLAERLARHYGLQAYSMRRQIGFESFSLPMQEALTKAASSKHTPVVVADQSDNTGGGAPGDATFALRWLLNHQVDGVAIAIFFDPEVVSLASLAGVGARLPVRLGGKTGITSGEPVDLQVVVLAVRDDYRHDFPQQSGPAASYPVGNVVALRCGGVDLIVGSKRCQCFSPTIFSDLGIDPTTKRILVVKSYQHFYRAFQPIAGDVIYMAAPGAVPPDPRQVAYCRVDVRRFYPWVADPLALD